MREAIKYTWLFLRNLLFLKDKKHKVAFIVSLLVPGGKIIYLAYVAIRHLKKWRRGQFGYAG